MMNQKQWNAKIEKHVLVAGKEAQQDMADGRWDEVMTDALYGYCGAEDREEMAEARAIAEEIATRAIEARRLDGLRLDGLWAEAESEIAQGKARPLDDLTRPA